MSNINYVNDDNIIVSSKKKHGGSSLSMQIQAERHAKTTEWEQDAESVFKDLESIKKHAKELALGLVEREKLTKEQREYLCFYVGDLIDKIPEHMRNVKHISYVNKVIQSGVKEYIENKSK